MFGGENQELLPPGNTGEPSTSSLMSKLHLRNLKTLNVWDSEKGVGKLSGILLAEPWKGRCS